MKEHKKKIADCIAKGDTDEAFNLTQQYFPRFSSEIAVLQGNYSRLKKRYNAGALGLEKYNEGISKVSFDLIEMLSQTDTGAIEKKKSNPIRRLISFQMDFLKGVISEFSRSKLILFATLAFVIIVGMTTVFLMSQIMPTTWGKAVISATLLAFFTLIISSLGFLNAQIKQFQGTKSFLKFQEYSEPEE